MCRPVCDHVHYRCVCASTHRMYLCVSDNVIHRLKTWLHVYAQKLNLGRKHKPQELESILFGTLQTFISLTNGNVSLLQPKGCMVVTRKSASTS